MNTMSKKLMSAVFVATALLGSAGIVTIGTAVAFADQAEARNNNRGQRSMPRMRDHRATPAVRDHRSKVSNGAPAPRQPTPVVRDHRAKVSHGAPTPREAN